MTSLNLNSLYIRRESAETQEVTTPLYFNNVTVSNAIDDSQAVNKSQLDSAKQDIINQLSTLSPNIEEIQTIEFSFQSYGTYGTDNYVGLGNISLLDNQGYPYYPIAYSWNKNGITTPTNSVSMYLGWKQIWLEPYNEDSFNAGLKSARAMTTPLSQEDSNFLIQHPNAIKIDCIIDSYSFVANYYDWGFAPFSFKLAYETGLVGSSQSTLGSLIAAYYPIKYRFRIDADNVKKFLDNIVAMQFSSAAFSGGTAIYSSLSSIFQKIYNDKFLETNIIINPLKEDNTFDIASNPTLAKHINLVNLTRDIQYNDFRMSSLVTNVAYPNNSNNAIYSSIIWDDNNQIYKWEAR